MARELILQTGAIAYRTKLTDFAQADRFAKCIRANVTRFCDVEVCESQKAKKAAWYVTFRPVNLDRQGDMLDRQWNAREQRAKTEGMDYIFWRDSDRHWVYWCFNPISGETYEVTSGDCSCPDWKFRCCKVGIQCKHQQAWEAQSRAGRVDKQVPVMARGTSASLAQRFADMGLNVNADF